jgi:hypothetical protein
MSGTIPELGIELTLDESRVASMAINRFGNGGVVAEPDDCPQTHQRVSGFFVGRYVRDCLFTMLAQAEGLTPLGKQTIESALAKLNPKIKAKAKLIK